MMKKISILMAAIAALAMTSCNRVSQDQYQQAVNSKDSLMTVALQQSNELYEISTTLRAVSEQLDQINGQLEISNGEDQDLLTKRNRLMQQLATLQQNMQDKQTQLEELQEKYSAQLGQNKLLKQTIDRLQNEVSVYQKDVQNYKNQVAAQQQRIASLTENLEETQEELTQTQQQNEMQQQVISNQDQMLNTAFYVVADKKQLKALGLLEGGVFSKKRLTRQGFSETGFTKIDIRDVTEIHLGARKADILTSHPASSYQLVPGAGDLLVIKIKDQTAFWSNSHFLVVKTK